MNQYTATFDANGGTGGKTVTQDYGTPLVAPTVTRGSDYVFAGWSPAVPTTMPAENVTYTAQWQRIQCTITFNANGGTGGKTVTLNYGSALVAPTVTRTGYTFTGWSPAVPSTVQASATYTAQWRIKQYTIVFDANGGAGGRTVTQDYGSALVAPTVTRTGYTFTGWSPSVPSAVPAGNKTYTAQWRAIASAATISGTWYVNGMTGSDSNPGTSESAPKATIQAAIDASSAGDTILVAPGTYAPIATENKAIAIRSTGGADVTIIDGNDQARCVTVVPAAWIGVDDRWFSTANTNTCLYGFTLRNGNAGTSFAERRFGGGSVGGSFYGCVFRDNKAGGGGGAKLCALYSCLLVGNWAYNGAATESSVCYNCTIVANTAGHTAAAGWDSAFINCIIWGNQGWNYYYAGDDESGIASAMNYCKINVYEDNPRFVDAANDDYRLSAGSPCINAGDNSYATDDLDLAGNARIANDTVDIGCYEYGSKAKVVFNANGGSVSVAHKLVAFGSTFGELPTPTWGGHTFVGWFTDKMGGMQVTSSMKCTGSTTVYARWTMKQYKLTFNANGGSVSTSSIVMDYCAAYGTLPKPTWGGHTFKGWYTARTGGTKVTSAMKCTGNKTIYAQWTVNQYKLTFNGNGGTASPAYALVDYCKTCDTFPTPTWSGHAFNGWYTARSGGTKVTAPWKCTGNKTIYAQWTVKQYKLTFNGNGGTASPGYKMVDYCKTCDTFPTPTWSGHTFNGWFTARSGGTQVTAPWKCIGNKTIYAQWTAKQYTITFNANGGSVSPASQKVDYCATYTLPTPAWGGHTFDGWYTAQTGGTRVSSPAKCTGNATLYAHWK